MLVVQTRTQVHGIPAQVRPYDGNLTNYPKETKELIKLCKRACDRVAKEIK